MSPLPTGTLYSFNYYFYTYYCMRQFHAITLFIFELNSSSNIYYDNIDTLFEVTSPRDGLLARVALVFINI